MIYPTHIVMLGLCAFFASAQYPVIDITCLFQQNNQDRLKIGNDIVAALKNYGYFIAIGAIISEDRQGKQIQAAKRLFAETSDEEKENHKMSIKNHTNFARGFIRFGSESGLSSIFEPKEAFSHGNPDTRNSSNPLESVNVWPENINQTLKMTIESVFFDHTFVVNEIVNVLSEVLSIEFDDVFDYSGSISLMRLFHYLALPDSDTTKHLGSSAHTDWGFLTSILGDSGGLQVYHDGWVDVPAIKGSIIINAGDFLGLITKNLIHAPIHRVLAPSTVDRFSYVLFHYPKYNFRLATLNHATRNDEAVICNDDTSNNLVFNTLTDHNFNENELFGDIIVKKWQQVYRLNE